MLKSVLKEVFIIILLCVAIGLILGILFYDYIPINKTVPPEEAYITPNEVKKELEENITETEKIEVSYEITDSDLNIYKQTGSYTEGKSNPFSLQEEQENVENNQVTNNVQTNNVDNKDNSQTNTFWNDEGIK